MLKLTSNKGDAMSSGLFLWTRLGAAAAFAFVASAQAADPNATPPHKLLLGIGFAAPYNAEEPFLNIAQTRKAEWQFQIEGKGQIGNSEAIKLGYLNPATALPTPASAQSKFVTPGVFLSFADKFPSYYTDSFTLSWKGEARGMMQRWDGAVPAVRGPNSVTYTLPTAKVRGGSMRFSSIGDGFGDIRLYRKKYEDRLNRGEIWNPEFLAYISRYDIIRTLDIQAINNSNVRRFDQVATMDESWGQRSTVAWPERAYFGVPYEILFDLGIKADVEMWMMIPPMIGAPVSIADPRFKREDKPGRVSPDKFRAAVEKFAPEALKSKEWDIFAKEFVDRYLASGYPLSRPLYLEIGNEIWNFSGGFYASTHYALGVAKSIDPKWQVGQGYGVLVAREMMAFEKEFARRGVKPNVTYIIGSHTANSWRTKLALDGVIAYLKANGEDPAAYMPKTAVAVTNYYGHFNEMSLSMFGVKDPKQYAPMWEAEIRKDPDAFARRVSDLLINGSPTIKATGPWILARYKEHKTYAEKAGSRLLGGYEGGSHLVPPSELQKSKVFVDWWMDYHWGEQGADVARQINRDLLAEFPGIVLANYRGMGVPAPGVPWDDGHYSDRTPMLLMWDEFANKPTGN